MLRQMIIRYPDLMKRISDDSMKTLNDYYEKEYVLEIVLNTYLYNLGKTGSFECDYLYMLMEDENFTQYSTNEILTLDEEIHKEIMSFNNMIIDTCITEVNDVLEELRDYLDLITLAHVKGDPTDTYLYVVRIMITENDSSVTILADLDY